MSRRGSRVVIGGMVAVALALTACGKAPEKAEPKPPKVTVTAPEEREVLEYEELPGRVAAIENVVVRRG